MSNGEFIAFRNWQNPDHVAETARVWNVEPAKLPTWTPPTHAMQIFHLAETGSIRLPVDHRHQPRGVAARARPDPARSSRKEDLFVVVSDAFLTETAQLADVVLPAAIWGEKTGCTTNADRTVHLSEKAIDPPGEARSDLDILLDYARRMDFRDKDGAPLVKWSDAGGRVRRAGRSAAAVGRATTPAMSYASSADRARIQWPCTDDAPEGRERQYEDGVFNTVGRLLRDVRP